MVSRKRTFVLAMLAVGALVFAACGSPDQTPTSTEQSVATPTPTPMARATATPEPQDQVGVQYCQTADQGGAEDIANARNWPLVQTCEASDLEQYGSWVLVGGQNANPIYKLVFGDAITAGDEGFTVIRRNGSFGYGGSARKVWGIAGWSSSDTISATQYVIVNGLPDSNVKERY